MQALSSILYREMIPKYFVHFKERANVLSSMKIPENVSRNALLFFQDDADGVFYTLCQTLEYTSEREKKEAEGMSPE